MNISRVRTVAVIGVEGFLVDVEAARTSGPPGLHLYGLPERSISEVRDRVRAAIHNSGFPWQHRHLTVGLLPASLPKHGTGYDLAIAVALLSAQHVLPEAASDNIVFVAELGLDGALRPARGLLPAAQAAATAGYSTIVVAPANLAEASAVPGINAAAADNLADVVAWLRGGPSPQITSTTVGPVPSAREDGAPSGSWPDLADLPNLPHLHQALEVSAAGGHHLLLIGRDRVASAGRALLPLLPDLTAAASLEVSAIHSAAGRIDPAAPLITRPPYRNPAPTASRALLCGTLGRTGRPGEMALAHRGVLHLDNAPEFAAGPLDALRGPLEEGQVQIEQAGHIACYPARFTLLITMAPCPCGAARDANCHCEPAPRSFYLGRLGGPILNRIDIKVRLPDPQSAEIPHPPAGGITAAVVAECVAAARARTARRLADTPWTTNAEIPAPELRRQFRLTDEATAPLRAMVRSRVLSARAAAHVVRLAWTLADLADHDAPTAADVTGACKLHRPV
jgi:magnesium chelatase family protein